MSCVRELVCAAIDFGTTYSGYAYSFRDEYNKDPNKIYSSTEWSDGAIVTPKTPTVVLFDRHKKFHSFGYEAETNYSKFVNNEEHEGWRYFRRFKMMLFARSKQRLRLDVNIEDDQGKSMPALDVFAASISYLKDHLLEKVGKRLSDITVTDIRWVLTVPAIWDDAAKQFMTKAALKAGIPQSHLVLAYEPEAAALYCKEAKLQKEQSKTGVAQLSSFSPGTQFIIVDCGGGTVDVSAHQVQTNGSLANVSEPSGGPWGGTMVDQHLDSFIEELFTSDVLKKLSDSCKPDKLDMDRAVELKKRLVTPAEKDSDNVHMKLPYALFEIYRECHPDEPLEASIKQGRFAETVSKKRDRLHISTKIFANMFNKSIQEIVKHLKGLLSSGSLRDVNMLLMVGGYSDSKILQTAIRTAFPDHAVIAPEDGSLSIVKGAVMYGHNPEAICSRQMPHSYGISTAVPFKPGVHPNTHRHRTPNDIDKCEDIFAPIVKIGEVVKLKQSVFKKTFTAPRSDASVVAVEVYKTDKKPCPMFTTECARVGELRLELGSYNRTEKAKIDVEFHLGDTAITVVAKEHGTWRSVKSDINFLR